MSLTQRDRRILLVLVPVVLLIAYWFLLLSPKRNDLKSARDEQHAAEQARDQAVAQAAQLEHARVTFARDYATVVRLGKAIPATVDSPSLLVQLDRAAKGTHIDFDSVTFGARAASTAPAAAPTTQAPSQPNGNAAAGGAPAQTAPGQTVENAENTVTQANQSNTAGDTSTTTTATTTTATASTAPAALETVPLTFNFQGSYFDLADFFHRLKRFVYVVNDKINVNGRLLTIDTLTFAPSTSTSGTDTGSNGQLSATVGATVYLTPAGQGVTAGATPSRPGGTATGTTTTTPSGSQTSSVPLATAGTR